MTAKAKERLFAAILGLGASTLMLYVGYRLNSYLERDILSIEFVELVPYQTEIVLPREDWHLIKGSDAFMAYVPGLSEGETELIHKKLPRLTASNGEAADIERILTGFGLHITRIRDKLKEFIESQGRPDIAQIQQLEQFLYVNGVYNRGDPRMMNTELYKLSFKALYVKSSLVCEAVQRVHKVVREYKASPTGDIDVKVTMLNSGGTDALVGRNAELVLLDPGQSIPILGKVVQIPKHSIIELMFSVNKQSSNLDLLKTRLGHVESPVKIKLRDIRDNVIESARLHCLWLTN